MTFNYFVKMCMHYASLRGGGGGEGGVQPWFLLEHNFEIWAGHDGQNMYQQLEGSF